MLQCSRGLSLRAGHEVVATPGLVVARAQFVEQEPERMQWIVEFVQHRRSQDPHRLIPLHFLQARSQGVGAVCGFLRGGEARANADVVHTNAEEGADKDGKYVVDERVGMRHRPGQDPVTDPRLGEHVEDDVHRACERTADH
jgi:hypothetical protein